MFYESFSPNPFINKFLNYANKLRHGRGDQGKPIKEEQKKNFNSYIIYN
jgi:hypothetical protein